MTSTGLRRPEQTPGPLRRALVLGAGLIGTSVAFALRERGVDVLLDDPDRGRVEMAARLGAGRPASAEPGHAGDGVNSPARDGLASDSPVDMVVLAVPPSKVAAALHAAQKTALGLTYMDTASIKARPLAEAEALGCEMDTFVGGHPLAGRERPGPSAARADLFLGRPWVLTPTTQTSAQALERARAVVHACGALPVEMAAEVHDRAVAAVSHVPQLVASALAASLLDLPDAAVALAGQGLRDVLRIADSDAALWAEITVGNAPAVGAALATLGRRLSDLAERLLAEDGADPATAEAVAALVRAGRTGRDRVPGKHGGRPVRFADVAVAVPDRPGELARLFADAGRAGVNVEDVAVEHEPGRPVGVVHLYVDTGTRERLQQVLAAAGWSALSVD